MGAACASCDCAAELNTVQNNECTDGDLGNQIVKVFIQKMTGADFDGTATNLYSDSASWDLKLGAPVNPDDKIIVIECVGVFKSSDPNMLSGNDVRYGGKQVIDRPMELDLKLTHPSKTTIEDLNKASCWPAVKVGFLDNLDNLWVREGVKGELIPNCYVIFNNAGLEGIATKTSVPFKISYNNKCIPVPISKLPFLVNKTN